MNKRYQVFLSSTFADLKEERKLVSKALRNSGCFVEEMEQFPAADQDQMEFIRNVIDPCDYYLLLIRNRYGSMNEKGVSFTEMEFDYAKSRGIFIIALVYAGKDDSAVNVDQDIKLKKKLERFKSKVMNGRIVKPWHSDVELVAATYESIRNAITNHPATGWVKADLPANAEILNEINELRKLNEALASENRYLKELRDLNVPNVASLSDVHEIPLYPVVMNHGQYTYDETKPEYFSVTWRDLFIGCAKTFLKSEGVGELRKQIIFFLSEVEDEDDAGLDFYTILISDIEMIYLQFRAQNLIKIIATEGHLSFQLTGCGEKLFLSEKAIKSKNI